MERSILQASNSPQSFLADVWAGFAKRPRQIPCKYLYDERGSALFRQICELPEYVLTRTELEIMRRAASDISAHIGPRACVVELGSGSGEKTLELLGALVEPSAYAPIDICEAALQSCAKTMRQAHPALRIMPLCADYTQPLAVLNGIFNATSRLIYFPGSTIGNFRPLEARRFLGQLLSLAGRRGGLLIGVDLKKDPALIEAAYNDAQGVTAAFNVNILHRICHELEGELSIDAFKHHAPYIEQEGCVEMRLVNTKAAPLNIGGRIFSMDAGDFIVTERSYKYSIREFTVLAQAAGWRCEKMWSDASLSFGVWLLRHAMG